MQVSASKRDGKQDIIEPEVTVTTAGTKTIVQSLGLDFEWRDEWIRQLTGCKEEWLVPAVRSFASCGDMQQTRVRAS